MPKRKIYYDTEFIDTGRSIDLISIALVDTDGRELYCVVNSEDTITKAAEHPWLRANVLPSLPIRFVNSLDGWEWDGYHDDWFHVLNRAEVADRVCRFIAGPLGEPELWAWYGAYDYVALAQLFGPLIDLPTGIPMWANDLRQQYARLGEPAGLPEQPNGEHNALADARHNRVRADWLADYARRAASEASA
jgi:hypothetical protein